MATFKNKLRDPQRHSFHFEQVRFQSALTWLSYQRAKKCRRTDGQTAFQLYIVESPVSIRADMAELSACQKVQTDGRTDGFSALYSRKIHWVRYFAHAPEKKELAYVSVSRVRESAINA